MAFATTNVKKTVFGNLKVMVGNWTGSAGDAPGTIQAEGGQIYLSNFMPNATSGPSMAETFTSPSGTAGIVTLTVYNQGTVTAGTFIIISA